MWCRTVTGVSPSSVLSSSTVLSVRSFIMFRIRSRVTCIVPYLSRSLGSPIRDSTPVCIFCQIGIVVIATLFYAMLVLKSESFKTDDYVWFGLMVFGCVEMLLICFMVIRHLLKEIAKFEQ